MGGKRIIKTTCKGCHGGCGVLITVEDGVIVHVEGNPDSVTEGTMCAKGLSQLQHVNNPYRIALLRIAPDSTCPEILKKNPHICFKVPNVEEAIKGREVIIPPYYNSFNAKVAYILVDGVNVEFIEASADLKY